MMATQELKRIEPYNVTLRSVAQRRVMRLCSNVAASFDDAVRQRGVESLLILRSAAQRRVSKDAGPDLTTRRGLVVRDAPQGRRSSP
jgi:hypothetical protein